MEGKSLEAKSIVPCEIDYCDNTNILNPINTCIGVFRAISFFAFPSLPRSFEVLAFLEGPVGSYEVSMNIVDDNGNIIYKGDKNVITIPSPGKEVLCTTCFLNLKFQFNRVTFPKEGIYTFQFISDGKNIFNFDFQAGIIARKEYSPSEIDQILSEPHSIKTAHGSLKCECGHIKNFSMTLDPSKQKDDERIPDEHKYVCPQCGKEILVSPEFVAHMKFYLGTNDIVDIISRGLRQSKSLARFGFLNSALIAQVSAFEAFMKDIFVGCFEEWFLHHIDINKDLKDEVNKTRQIIEIKLIKNWKIDGVFFQQLVTDKFVEKDTLEDIYCYNSTIKMLIFGDEDHDAQFRKLNFQQLLKKNGCFWAYKNFLGIDIISELKSHSTEYDHCAHLVESFKVRHDIIHNSSKVELVSRRVTPGMLDKNERIMLLIRDYVIRQVLELDKKKKALTK